MRKVNPIVKQVLELGPTLVFFVLYLQLRDGSYTIAGVTYSGFIMATLIFVPILLLAMAILWRLSGSLSRMQIFTAFMVIFFGGLTAYFNDERFFKIKTSIVYGSMSTVLFIGLLRGQSFLQLVLGEVLPMKHEGWIILTRRLAMMFAALAMANELIWRNLSTDLWVKLETFAMPAALMAFLLLQLYWLQQYIIEDQDKSDP